MPWYYYATVAVLLLSGLVLCLGKIPGRHRDPKACRISEEWQGYFIGRKYCGTHNITWDDGGRCPRAGQEPGQPFHMMSWGEPSGRRW